ncbi:unnamed protein product [Protopolystoma xenopodis]|uniref:Uncharacterized protein n=1 Tax=Protopolystoma xenopodis TaxID=117903 RepID=A0A448XBU2_9PLAT|nr:unnamed protein product [Protopolystoma xenopodis]
MTQEAPLDLQVPSKKLRLNEERVPLSFAETIGHEGAFACSAFDSFPPASWRARRLQASADQGMRGLSSAPYSALSNGFCDSPLALIPPNSGSQADSISDISASTAVIKSSVGHKCWQTMAPQVNSSTSDHQTSLLDPNQNIFEKVASPCGQVESIWQAVALCLLISRSEAIKKALRSDSTGQDPNSDIFIPNKLVDYSSVIYDIINHHPILSDSSSLPITLTSSIDHSLLHSPLPLQPDLLYPTSVDGSHSQNLQLPKAVPVSSPLSGLDLTKDPFPCPNTKAGLISTNTLSPDALLYFLRNHNFLGSSICEKAADGSNPDIWPPELLSGTWPSLTENNVNFGHKTNHSSDLDPNCNMSSNQSVSGTKRKSHLPIRQTEALSLKRQVVLSPSLGSSSLSGCGPGSTTGFGNCSSSSQRFLLPSDNPHRLQIGSACPPIILPACGPIGLNPASLAESDCVCFESGKKSVSLENQETGVHYQHGDSFGYNLDSVSSPSSSLSGPVCSGPSKPCSMGRIRAAVTTSPHLCRMQSKPDARALEDRPHAIDSPAKGAQLIHLGRASSGPCWSESSPSVLSEPAVSTKGRQIPTYSVSGGLDGCAVCLQAREELLSGLNLTTDLSMPLNGGTKATSPLLLQVGSEM